MAYRNQGHISARDVLAEVYGFPVTVNLRNVREGALIFDCEAIGINRYQSASVAVCKAFNRLAHRSLADRIYNHGIKLTETGVKVAEALSQGSSI